jgi:hypothetical protein
MAGVSRIARPRRAASDPALTWKPTPLLQRAATSAGSVVLPSVKLRLHDDLFLLVRSPTRGRVLERAGKVETGFFAKAREIMKI